MNSCKDSIENKSDTIKMESKQSSNTTRTHKAGITFSSARKIQAKTNSGDNIREIDIVKLILQREEFIRHLEKYNKAVLKDDDAAKRAKEDQEAVEDKNNNTEVAKHIPYKYSYICGFPKKCNLLARYLVSVHRLHVAFM